jgi:hypothetical protein
MRLSDLPKTDFARILALFECRKKIGRYKRVSKKLVLLAVIIFVVGFVYWNYSVRISSLARKECAEEARDSAREYGLTIRDGTMLYEYLYTHCMRKKGYEPKH